MSVPILATLLSLASPHVDAPTTTTTEAVVTTTTTTAPPTSSVWWRVAVCEERGTNDATFGYFGIYVSSWLAYGGGQYAPTPSGATYWQQVDIAERIDGSYVPDAYGCASW